MSLPGETLPPPPPPSSTSATPTNTAEMVHYLLPHGEFLICRNAVNGSTAEACRVLTREENEISRHYGKHHGTENLDYSECRAITRAAALAFAGDKKVAKASEKDLNDKNEVSASAKTPRDPLWFPSAAQQAALGAAAAPVAAAALPAAALAPVAPAPAPSAPVAPASAPAVAAGPAAAPGVAPPASVAPPAAARPARPTLPAANNPFAGVSAYNAHFNALGERIAWSSDEEDDEDDNDGDDDEDGDDDDDDDESEDTAAAVDDGNDDEEMTG